MVLSVLVIGVLLVLYQSVGIVIAAVVAVVPIATWTLGRLHERAIVIEGELVNEDDLRAAEYKLHQELTLLRLLRSG